MTAELGYYIAEEYWGKGIMAKAVRQACRYVFDNSDIIRIYAEPFAFNAASCRVLEKAGFRYEGTLRSSAVKNGKNNRYEDVFCIEVGNLPAQLTEERERIRDDMSVNAQKSALGLYDDLYSGRRSGGGASC